MHFEAWSSNMYFHRQKQSHMIFFCFLFPNFKNSFPWHNDTLRSFSTAISHCYIRPPKLILGLLNEDRHQTSARLSSVVPGIRAGPLF